MKKYLLLLAMMPSLFAWSQTRFSQAYDYNIQYQVAFTMLELKNGGYLMGAKNIGPEYSDNKILLYRLDATGNEIWQKEIYAEGFIYYLHFGSMFKLPDGNYLIGGEIKELSTELSDVFLIKTDTSGNVLWEKTYGASDKQDFFGNFALTPDSAHIQVCGQTRRTDPSGNVWLFKTDLDGEMIWDQEIVASGWQTSDYMAMLADGSFFVSVHYGTVDLYQYKVYKISASGQILWQKKLGTEYDDSGFSKIVALPDGSGIFTGSVGTPDWRVHLAYAAKLSPSGGIVWEKTYHTGFSSYAFAQPVALGDGSLVLSGGVDYDTFNSPLLVRFWKIDADGEVLWERVYSHDPDSIDVDNYTYHQIGTKDGGFLGVGSCYQWSTLQDIWVLKLDSEGCLIENCTVGAWEPEVSAERLFVYPNPAANEIFVSLPDGFEVVEWKVIDVLGRVRQLQVPDLHTNPARVDISQLPLGLYWLQVASSDKKRVEVRPFQVIR